MLRAIFVAALILTFPAHALACPAWFGTAVLHAAWVTPKYTKCDWNVEDDYSGAKKITVKAYGTSTISWLDDKEVWVEAVVTLDSGGGLKEIRWGKYKAFFRPGTALEVVAQALQQNGRIR
jgi:hypothetical protein